MQKIYVRPDVENNKVYIQAEIECDVFPNAIQYQIKNDIELLKYELLAHCRHKPRNKDKLREWYSKIDSIFDDIIKLASLQSFGVDSYPLKIEDNKIIGFKNNIEVEIVNYPTL